MKKVLTMAVVTLMIAGSAAFAGEQCTSEKKAECSKEKSECSTEKKAECSKDK